MVVIELPTTKPSENGQPSGEYERFERLTKRLLQVPKKEMNRRPATTKRRARKSD